MTEMTSPGPRPADEAPGPLGTPREGVGPKASRRRRLVRAVLAVFLLAVIGVCGHSAARPLYGHYQLRASRHAVERYHNREAREHLEACLAALPDNPEALLLAARTARRMRAFAEAEQFLDGYRRARGEDDDLTLERVLLRAELGDVDAVSRFGQKLVSEGDPRSDL